MRRKLAMNDMTRRYLDGFWELLDDMLNALLFALIGLELLLLPFNWLHVFAASLAKGEMHPLAAPFSIDRFHNGALIDEHGAAAVAH